MSNNNNNRYCNTFTINFKEKKNLLLLSFVCISFKLEAWECYQESTYVFP